MISAGTPSLLPWPQPGPTKHTEGGRPAALTECKRQEHYCPQFVVHEKKLYLKVTEQHLQEDHSSPSSGAIVENLTSIKEVGGGGYVYECVANVWSLSLLILCSSAGHVTVSVCVLQKAHRVTFTAKARKLHIHVTEVLFTGSSIFSPVDIYPTSVQDDCGCGYWNDLH